MKAGVTGSEHTVHTERGHRAVSADTTVHEIADGIYRISTPVRFPSGAAFTFPRPRLVTCS